MIPRPVIARLHRINRNRRVVRAVSAGICLAFRCVPLLLWDEFDWAHDLRRRASAGAEQGDEAFLRRIFRQPERDYLPWRLTDVMGVTARRRTPLGKLWEADHQARYWAGHLKWLPERYGVTLDEEGAKDAS